MYRRLHPQLGALILLPLLTGGCVQMTRHSNMMIFGTNTVVGVRAGVNATSVPEVSIGFTRQEAVVLPLVANVAEGTAGRLAPCNVGAPVVIEVPSGGTVAFPKHPCLLAADRDGAKDSYSVLASFGGNFVAEGAQGQPSAKAAVAQYFSTGMAAQLLALNGGAAVVATGAAAVQSAEKTPVNLTQLTPSSDEIRAAALAVQKRKSSRDALAEKVSRTSVGTLRQNLEGFENSIGGLKKNGAGQCTTPDSCAKMVLEGFYNRNHLADETKFDAAVSAWPTVK